MISTLILLAPLLLASTPQPAAQPPGPQLSTTPPPIKMGLWEATTTTATGTKMKTRACMTQQSYQQQMAHIPSNCTMSNMSRTSTHISGDISCKTPNGSTSSSGHFDAEFPDSSTIQSTVSFVMTVQGHTMPVNIQTQSHYIGADCGGIAPGQAQIVH